MKRPQVAVLLCCIAVAAVFVWLSSRNAHRRVINTDDNGIPADLAPSFLARKERWATKTGADDDSDQIDIAHPEETTVQALTSADRPFGIPSRGGPGGDRFGPIEHKA